MRRFCLLLSGTLALLLANACDSTTHEKQEVVVQEVPPAVDSLQLQLKTYELQLDSARSNITLALRQLDRVSRQLQDSIQGTQVPPQLQEETINTYRNKLHDVHQMQAALRHWQQQDQPLPDTVARLQRKELLEKQLLVAEELLQESWRVRSQSREAMLESDREEY